MGQFLNCVYGSSRIVLLTIQELSKAQCNNTDNNYTDYSDTDPFLSLPIRNGKEMIRYYITDDEAVVCLYCRKFFAISYKSVIDKH